MCARDGGNVIPFAFNACAQSVSSVISDAFPASLAEDFDDFAANCYLRFNNLIACPRIRCAQAGFVSVPQSAGGAVGPIQL